MNFQCTVVVKCQSFADWHQKAQVILIFFERLRYDYHDVESLLDSDSFTGLHLFHPPVKQIILSVPYFPG